MNLNEFEGEALSRFTKESTEKLFITMNGNFR